MKLYKYKDLFALMATIGWMSSMYSAFQGFHFWYLPFVFFFWLSLGILNYRHESTLWLLKNRISRFVKYYLTLALLGFIADYIIGQVLVGFWIYPFYNDASDWWRLYLLIYPIGGLSLVELVYFLSAIFKERVILVHENIKNFTVFKFEFLIEILLVFAIVFCLAFKDFVPIFYTQNIIVILFSIWIILTTLKLKHYLKHSTHWIAIIGVTAILSVFLHEVPNTIALEWKYSPPTLFFDYQIFDVHVWVVLGWYLLVLVMLKYWIEMVLLKDRK